eukprot:TRINITY_DN4473_c0_g1_i1.p1 TRINITY_DN4473_c0_g1~~TRINITY_DN4473_c0_g1_i1.p1  ORF type:complete len:118 (-),score=34.26 TRINITY_DN4473_c0_g1_i1:55-408(-)
MSSQTQTEPQQTVIQTLFPSLCAEKLNAFIQCATENRKSMAKCKDLFEDLGECTFVDDSKVEADDNPEMSVFGKFAQENVARLFDPDTQEHEKSPVGGFVERYLPRFFSSGDGDGDD